MRPLLVCFVSSLFAPTAFASPAAGETRAPVSAKAAAAHNSALPPQPIAFAADATLAHGIRGMTVGPIESGLHPGRGYGSVACERALQELSRAGVNWVSFTPFGRVANLAPTGIDWTFEAPFAHNRANVLAAIHQAHALGLRVMLVPHLWVESGEWRALIDPPTAAGWIAWAKAYREFVLAWAEVAQEGGVDLFSMGAELRSWVTGDHASAFAEIIQRVRRVYRGTLTYSANWDDVEDTIVLGALDIIGINAFYPLALREGATLDELLEGGERVALRVRELHEKWHKPVIFTEAGYTTRTDPALRPWEWPDSMQGVKVDQWAQAQAFYALLRPLIGEPSFGGFFVWRQYADPDDASQEAEWGFSPRGKLAEPVLRRIFAARWRTDSLP